MRQTKAKELRRLAQASTIGQSAAKTRAAYRQLKRAAKVKATVRASDPPSRHASPIGNVGVLARKPAQHHLYRPHGLIGRNPRREWEPGPLIIAKGRMDNPRRLIGKLRLVRGLRHFGR